MICHSVSELIGRTPLLRLHRLEAQTGAQAELLAKLESFNPGGSAKDRIAAAMLDAAEAQGLLTPGATVIEPTSGNTGMPETMSVERQKLLRAYGAQVVLTPGSLGMQGAVAEAERLSEALRPSFIPAQFQNPANPRAHYETTGPELYAACDGNLDILVASVGTGGTITGTGRYLKEQNPAIQVVAVEPASSPLLSEGHAGPHKIQGIGANFVPDTLDRSLPDRILTVTDEDAFACARLMARTEGVLVGISAGATLAAAIRLAKQPEHRGARIAAILTDTGERYLSSGLFDETN